LEKRDKKDTNIKWDRSEGPS